MAKRKIKHETVDGIRRNILESVGYGRPPESTRFKKGVSGNPAGRPRKEPAMDVGMTAAVLKESRRPVTVQENGETYQITARDAVIRAQIKSAATGSPYAQEYQLRRFERAEKEEIAAIEAANAVAEMYVEACRRKIEAAQEAGEPIPEFLPHPDDIIIEPGKPYKIVGPASDEELEYYKRACALREIALLDYTLKVRQEPAEAICGLFEISVIDARLPRRMRLPAEWPYFSPYRRVTSAKLRKLIRTASRELGVTTQDRD